MEKLIQYTETVWQERTLGELKSMLDRLPRLGKEAKAFEKYISEVWKQQPVDITGYLKVGWAAPTKNDGFEKVGTAHPTTFKEVIEWENLINI